nr:transposase, MuDR, MULE transposase domain protein [Tanacetum cinerariifolium]
MIDAAHLKGLYKRTNLVAVAMDGNNQIMQISFGICKGETSPCWSWWMSVLKECIGDNPNLLFISDRHAAIAFAVENEFPLALSCCMLSSSYDEPIFEKQKKERFGVENLADYNDGELPIPFRRRVFPSSSDGVHITSNTVLRIIEDELFDRLHDDVIILCCLGILLLVLLGVEGKHRIRDWMLRLANDRTKLYATQPTTKIDKKLYSIFGYTWEFKTWILESFRVTMTKYYNCYNRYPRVAAWKKGKFMGTMVHGNMPAVRLTPDETEARSDWWISSRNSIDNLRNKKEILKKRDIEEIRKKKLIIKKHMKNPIPSHDAAGLYDQNILNQGKRDQRPSIYKQSPYREQPPSTVLPKKHGNKTKNNVKKSNLSPLNLGNALDDDNEGGDDVMFLGAKFTGYYLVYENVDVSKGYLVPVTFWQQLVPHLCMPDIDSNTPVGWLSCEHMNLWMELLIRNRPKNAL